VPCISCAIDKQVLENAIETVAKGDERQSEKHRLRWKFRWGWLPAPYAHDWHSLHARHAFCGPGCDNKAIGQQRSVAGDTLSIGTDPGGRQGCDGSLEHQA